MIAHALTIVRNELNRHLKTYGEGNDAPTAELGNLAELSNAGNGNSPVREKIILSVVNIQEDKTVKNAPTYVRNDVTLRVTYENPPTFLNLLVLVVATHATYTNALLSLSRTLLFFQAGNVFSHDQVHPSSLENGAPVNALDRLISFKLVFDLYSPSMEEVNHLWGTLGGRQYPFALYVMRMLELKSAAVHREAGLITEVSQRFAHKPAVAL